jgi:peptide/nickel transport system permease protein
MAVLEADVSVPSPPEVEDVPAPSRRRRRRTGSLEIWIPAGLLVLIVGGCFLWPIIGNVQSPINGNILNANLPVFSPGHIFGTDPVGNDVFSRILYGGRVSIEVGLGSNLIGLVVGGLIGVFAAYRSGWVESVIMRVLDVFIAFPSLVLALAIAEYLGPGELNVIWALSFFSVPAFARLARAQTLRLRESNFILAARLSGTRSGRVIFAHIIPNVISQLVTFSFLGVSITIILEASLSFLGLGVRLPNPSWGDMISQGQEYLSSNPDLVLIPSAFLFATVVALNVLGDGLRARWGQR